MIKGAYAFAIVDANNPEILYATRLSSPLVIGVGKGENFLALGPVRHYRKHEKFCLFKRWRARGNYAG